MILIKDEALLRAKQRIELLEFFLESTNKSKHKGELIEFIDNIAAELSDIVTLLSWEKK